MQTIPHTVAAGTLTFPQALQQVTELARTKLPPTLHERLTRAVALVDAGRVWFEDDGVHAAVQSLDGARWHAVNASCDCEDAAYRAEGGFCQHRLAVGLVRRAQELMYKPVVLPEDEAPPSGIDPRFITHLHGKPFVRYAGLLALAHERGLVQLTARIEFHSETLVLASATATFQDGRTFTEWADSSPTNVGAPVRPHWVRMALTRAKARCLRDALGVDLVAVEELSEEGGTV